MKGKCRVSYIFAFAIFTLSSVTENDSILDTHDELKRLRSSFQFRVVFAAPSRQIDSMPELIWPLHGAFFFVHLSPLSTHRALIPTNGSLIEKDLISKNVLRLAESLTGLESIQKNGHFGNKIIILKDYVRTMEFYW